uniref:Uncharacterized protein n=1 Tax=Anopheles coluzzii TaxID=1518534 RepID=A0A8W7PSP8_ANOCL
MFRVNLGRSAAATAVRRLLTYAQRIDQMTAVIHRQFNVAFQLLVLLLLLGGLCIGRGSERDTAQLNYKAGSAATATDVRRHRVLFVLVHRFNLGYAELDLIHTEPGTTEDGTAARSSGCCWFTAVARLKQPRCEGSIAFRPTIGTPPVTAEARDEVLLLPVLLARVCLPDDGIGCICGTVKMVPLLLNA